VPGSINIAFHVVLFWLPSDEQNCPAHMADRYEDMLPGLPITAVEQAKIIAMSGSPLGKTQACSSTSIKRRGRELGFFSLHSLGIGRAGLWRDSR
jgi:hypothetical protein